MTPEDFLKRIEATMQRGAREVEEFIRESRAQRLRLETSTRTSGLGEVVQKHVAQNFMVFKSSADQGVFAGYGSTWEVDEHRDKILPGAFSESIRKSGGKVPLLWHHRTDTPIGIATDLREDSRGLYFVGQLALGTEKGRETLELLKMGAVDGVSIGFMIPKGGDRPGPGGVREITKVELMELSCVTFPANRGARVEAGSAKGWL